jgi:hypothetical protein
MDGKMLTSSPGFTAVSVLGILILALLYFRCEFLVVIWAFIPSPVVICPLNSPQKACSGTGFPLRAYLSRLEACRKGVWQAAARGVTLIS